MENEISKTSNNKRIKNIIIAILSLLLVLSIAAVVYLYLNKEECNIETNTEIDQTNETEEENTDGVESIDFTLCEESECEYEISLDNEVDTLTYSKNLWIEKSEGNYVNSVLTLNGNNIIELNPIEQLMTYEIFKDLLVFGVNSGGGVDSYTLIIFDKTGNLLSDIYYIDKDTGMHLTKYWGEIMGISADDNSYYELTNDSIVFYASIFEEGLGADDYDGYAEDDIYSAKYKITYQDLIDGKEPTMVEVIYTVGNIIEYNS